MFNDHIDEQTVLISLSVVCDKAFKLDNAAGAALRPFTAGAFHFSTF